jgi:SAM-dependent methyltransferase
VSFYPDAAAEGFGWPADWAGIRALAVHPDHRGTGLARHLVEACIERAESAGAPTVGLHTAHFMVAAVRLYEQLGFRRAPTFDLPGDEMMDMVGPDGPLVIAYRRDLRPDLAADEYPLGRSEAETERLVLQHQIYGPLTRQFLIAAGVTRGMKVLDLGSGAGDVALLLADLVGPEGRVVGVDANPAILETARTRVRAAGWGNVELHQGDVRSLGLAPDFDAVVGRWILMYLPDPAELLRQAQAYLRPGGIVAFQESDLTTPIRTFPPLPLHDRVRTWTARPDGAPGPATDMGLQLRRTFVEAGLDSPHLRLDAPIGGGPDWPGYAYLADSVRSLLPFLEQIGTVTHAEVDVETLEDRLRAEVVGHDGIQILPSVIGAWART